MNRHGIALVAIATLVLASGCLGLVLGDGLEEEAQPARVDEATLEDSEFQFQQADTVEINETVTAAGQERRIHATNHVALYTRESEIPGGQNAGQGGQAETAGFTVVSTPEFAVAGQPLNPVASMSNRQLVEELQGQLEDQLGSDIQDLRVVDDREETMLGEETNVTTFAADTRMNGREQTINLHVGKVTHEGDVVVAVGVHPEEFGHFASEIHELIRNVEHPVEESAS